MVLMDRMLRELGRRDVGYPLVRQELASASRDNQPIISTTFYGYYYRITNNS
jgi:hypothetical protein